jgi:hypothetical protein
MAAFIILAPETDRRSIASPRPLVVSIPVSPAEGKRPGMELPLLVRDRERSDDRSVSSTTPPHEGCLSARSAASRLIRFCARLGTRVRVNSRWTSPGRLLSLPERSRRAIMRDDSPVPAGDSPFNNESRPGVGGVGLAMRTDLGPPATGFPQVTTASYYWPRTAADGAVDARTMSDRASLRRERLGCGRSGACASAIGVAEVRLQRVSRPHDTGRRCAGGEPCG